MSRRCLASISSLPLCSPLFYRLAGLKEKTISLCYDVSLRPFCPSRRGSEYSGLGSLGLHPPFIWSLGSSPLPGASKAPHASNFIHHFSEPLIFLLKLFCFPRSLKSAFPVTGCGTILIASEASCGFGFVPLCNLFGCIAMVSTAQSAMKFGGCDSLNSLRMTAFSFFSSSSPSILIGGMGPLYPATQIVRWYSNDYVSWLFL